jgi:hypothetical protein
MFFLSKKKYINYAVYLQRLSGCFVTKNSWKTNLFTLLERNLGENNFRLLISKGHENYVLKIIQNFCLLDNRELVIRCIDSKF